MSTADSWAAANWDRMLSERSADAHRFLALAARNDQAGGRRSLRLADRDDLLAFRSVIHLFPKRWWGVCIYSCVDRAEGARLVPSRAAWPARLIGSHWAQAGYRGSETPDDRGTAVETQVQCLSDLARGNTGM